MLPLGWIIGIILVGLLYLLFVVILLWKRNFILASIFFFLPYFSYKSLQYYWFTEILPFQIGVTYPLSLGTESGLVRGGCGVAVFKLSESTIKQIEKDGLEFLSRATQSRGYSNPYHQFEQWKETPVPPNWVSEGTWFMCSKPNKMLNDEIIKAAKESGSYYTTKHEGELIVIPTLGYAVLSYEG